MRTLIAGCGFVGVRLGEILAENGSDVHGLRRSAIDAPSFPMIAADLGDRNGLAKAIGGQGFSHLVYAASPGGRTEENYRRTYVEGLENTLAATGESLERLVLITSTAVFGQAAGEWVDEDSVTEPSSFTGKILLEAEATAARAACEATSFRLGGIYGPGRTRLVRLVATGTARIPRAPRFTNRIHRDDAARATAHLLRAPDLAPTYVGVDRGVAELADVYRFLAAELGVAEPELEDPDAEARAHKRCRSDRLVESGFTFAIPSYREGYPPIVAAYREDADE
ncbi:MAG: NAD-dependent epimerase/dehydratase family protein [Myxococcota bacterium]